MLVSSISLLYPTLHLMQGSTPCIVKLWNNTSCCGGTPVIFFFGKLTYVLKEEDTNIIRGIPQIYNDNRNIKQQMATG